MKWRVLLVAASFCAATLVFFLYQIVDRGPYDGPIPPITHEYFVCAKCRSLDGGIYGKGPHKRLRTAAGSRCIHNWRPITRAEFKNQAIEQFGIDWSQEIPFWSEDRVPRP